MKIFNRIVLPGAFFLSGAAGLIYEVAWSRMLTAILGSTVVASSIVMAVYMGGLALGAFLFGRVVARRASPLKLYALLEAAVGCSAFGITLILPHIPLLLSGGAWAAGSSFGASLFWKISVAALFLLIPAMLMGGTLPVLSRQVAPDSVRVGCSVGTLYGVNTLGAVVGCFASGFWLIEFLGLFRTCSLAALLNIGISCCCFLFLRNCTTPVATESGGDEADPGEAFVAENAANDLSPAWFLPLYALSGAAGLAYEVLWIRLLSASFIATSFSFAVMLGVCLTAMGLGSLSFRNRADSAGNPLVDFAALQVLLALWAECLLLLYSRLPYLQGIFARYAAVSLESQILEMLLGSLIIVFAPSFLLGALFPLAIRIRGGRRDRVGQNVASVYTWNTIGCVIGSLAAGLFLLPHFGIQHTLMLLGGINFAIALYAVLLSGGIPAGRRLLFGVAGTVAFSLLLFTLPGNLVQRSMADRLRAPWHLLSYQEGLDGNTMILENEQMHVRRLMTTFFQYIGDTSPVMLRIQKMQAHLPMLLAGRPQKILFVGMGTGITPATATLYPADITCCEISGGVMEASRFFAKENRDVLHNPLVQLIRDDGRHYLLQNRDGYDLIVGDLYNAALAGMGNLYSREYYTLCRNRLRAGGMMCQWISMKDIPEKELKSVMATFAEAFPNTALWCAAPDILAMVGTLEPLQVDLKRIEQMMRQPALHNELESIGLDSASALLSHFLMNRAGWQQFVAGAPVITDDRPFIEYSIPRSLHYLYYRRDMAVLLRHVAAGRTYLIPPEKAARNSFEERLKRGAGAESHLFVGYALFLEGEYNAAEKEYSLALAMDPQNKEISQMLQILRYAERQERG